MTDLTNLLAPYKARVELRPGSNYAATAHEDRAKLLAALEGVIAQCAQWEHAVSGDPSVEPTIPTARIRAAVVAALGEGK